MHAQNPEHNPFLKRRIKLFKNVIFGLAATCLGFYVIAYIHPDPVRADRVLWLASFYLVGLISVFFILRKGHLTAAINSTSLLVTTIVGVGILDAGRTGPTVWLFCIAILIGSFHITPKHIIMLGFINIAAAALVSSQVYVYDPMQMPAFYLQSIIITTLSYFSIRISQQNIRDIIASNRKLITANIALNNEKQRADKASQAKSHFLTTMSHELRTPLNAVIGYSQMIRESLETDMFDEEEAILDIQQVEKSGHHLLELVSNVLDLTRMESEHIELEPSTFSLQELLTEIQSTTQPKIKSKELELQLYNKIAPEHDALYQDRGRMQQILIGLLTNAIKFTNSGTISVICSELHSSQENVLQIEIRDTGVGISSEEQEQIFNLFTQVDSSFTRKADGTGVGLYLCHKLAQHLGGDLTVESEKGVGSSFFFSFTQQLMEQQS